MAEFNSNLYWEERYSQGGNSGIGSYGDSAILKANYINSIIEKYKIKTINELGHGDGNQISLLKGFTSYTGYDVSSSARQRCILQYKDNEGYTFLDSLDTMYKADLSLSLDVLYHITDYTSWEGYLRDLFRLGEYVLIYGMNKEENNNNHVVSRRFLPYIENVFDNYTLIDTSDGTKEDVKFYLYKKL
jgi:hypothetical protein